MKIAVIGNSGHWGAVVDGIQLYPSARIVAAAPGNAEENIASLLQRCEKDLGYLPQRYDDYRVMLDSEKPDVVAINPQFHLHGSLTLDCMRRKIHVYVEKPISLNLEELALIRKQWKSDKSIRLISMQELRYLPEFLAGYKHVRDGAIGKPLLLTAQKSYPLLQRAPFFRSRKTYGGTIPWIGIHAIDWIRWYAGSDFTEVHAAHSTLGNNDHGDLETLCILNFKLAGGGLAMANLDYLRSPKAGTWGDDRIRVMGEKGSVEVSNQKAVFFAHDQAPFTLPLEPKRSIFQEFLELVEGRDSMLLNTTECLRATEISLWARQSADEGKIMRIPPPL